MHTYLEQLNHSEQVENNDGYNDEHQNIPVDPHEVHDLEFFLIATLNCKTKTLAEKVNWVVPYFFCTTCGLQLLTQA